ncbi:hypothetical protein K2P97_01215 [bacterium]|nr:hypothetical protein [bacterium]
MSPIDTEKQSEIEIKKAAQLSITEITLGSLGHGLKIPLTGQLLSLNQLAFMLNVVNKEKLPKSSAFEISGIAAILKSFSPAGQKLGPMLSIAMQGFLFWLGTAIFGLNIVGQIIGAVALSLWAFIQPFVTLFMIYGFDLAKLIEFYSKRISDDYSFFALSLVYAVVAFMILKISVAVGFVIFSVSSKKEINVINQDKIGSALLRQMPSGKSSNALKSAVKDLFKPLFLLSFILMLVFIWQLNGTLGEKIWLSLRPLAIAFVIFYLLRSPWVAKKLLEWSNKSPKFEKIYSKSKSAWKLVTEKITSSDQNN